MDKNNLRNLSNTDNLGNSDMSLSAAPPFSRACENNKHAILEVLKIELISFKHVLEIGSGTGQHSVYFAPQLPKITWQTSDLVANHWAINAWHDAHPAANLYAPLPLDLAVDPLPISLSSNRPYDAVFTANTLHIIAWSLVEKLFESVGNALPIDGKLLIYGPFNESGHYTSEGNHRFDDMLRQQNPSSGIRHKEDVIELADQHHLVLFATHAMPASNQLLIFKKR
ncbi:SAM-dependent methyltransferase [Psychrobacter sp. PL19]|uniref:DUF938 domain-containing protein n=1 Tax=Psychrobacter sp. PL19 TaxID=2760711 RepID=UPI001AE3B087